MQRPQFEAHASMETRHWWFLARRKILQTLLHEVLPPTRGHEGPRLIDVGCGTGGLTHFLSAEYSVMGVDPSADAIAFAKNRFPECAFVRGEAPRDIVKEFEAADGILLIEVLEHVENDVEFVRDLIDHMKSGAYLFIMAPADMSLWSPHDTAFEHFRRYDSLDEFQQLWKYAPVDELLLSYCNARLHPIVKFTRKLTSMRGKSWGKGGTDITVPMAPVNAVLKRIFGDESRVLRKVLRGKRGEGYAKGVSVIAVLRKI